MGCGCNRSAAGAEPTRTSIKYLFNGTTYNSKTDAEAARQNAGGSGAIRTVAVRA